MGERPRTDTFRSDFEQRLNEEWGKMAKYLRPPSESQQRFLETLRDLGPRDNAQTAEVLRGTKHACQCRGWAEWRALDNFPSVKAWHLTIIGRRVLSS
jgi:hypothetical protein